MIQAPVLCCVSHCNQREKKKKRRKPGLSEEFHFNVNEREMIQNKSAQMKWQSAQGAFLHREPPTCLFCLLAADKNNSADFLTKKEKKTNCERRNETRARRERSETRRISRRVWTMSNGADEQRAARTSGRGPEQKRLTSRSSSSSTFWMLW